MQSIRIRRLPLALLPASVLLGLAACASAPKQGMYETPDAACDALVAALRSNDPAHLEAVLGKEGAELLSSGDEVADKANLADFMESYDARHDVVMEADEAVLVVGPDNWPLPLPLVKSDDSWHFDLVRGRLEILARRIGRNELSTIQVCRAIVDAQQEYASEDRTGNGAGEYAAKFLSTEGKRDGLFWPTKEGEAESPLGPLVAEAHSEGYRRGQQERNPYHGYCYRMLLEQGPTAPGGAAKYMVGGRMTGGFAVLAEPADWGNSGVMTFMVGPTGIVYQKNLGEKTTEVAATIQSFDPDPSWEVVED